MDTKNIKIEQWFQEKLNINLSQNIGESINVNLIPQWPQSIHVKRIHDPVKVEITKNPKNDFLYYESKELAFTWKTLLSLWIIWVIYWTYNLKVNSFLWINIIDTNNNLPWLIWIISIIECIIFILIFFRDYFKDFNDKKTIFSSNKDEINNLKKTIKELKDNGGNIEQSLTDHIEKLEIQNNEITLQNYQKNVIYYWLKVIYPLSLGLIWIISIWKDKILWVIKLFPIENLLIPIILFLILIFINFLKTKKQP